jgi:hypothetical protein
MRRSLVGIVVALAALGAGCSSQPPSAVSTAQQTVHSWAAAVNADTNAERAECAATSHGVGGVGCTKTSPPLFDKTCSDEVHLFMAEASLDRTEGHKPFQPPFSSCKALDTQQAHLPAQQAHLP